MREVDLPTFASARADGAMVIDVREPMEYLSGHVPGARLIPMGQLASRLAEIPATCRLRDLRQRKPQLEHDQLPRPRGIQRLVGDRRHQRVDQRRHARDRWAPRQRRLKTPHRFEAEPARPPHPSLPFPHDQNRRST